MFGFGWKQGSAVVVAKRKIKISVSDGITQRKCEYIVDVTPDDGSPPFRGTCVNWRDAEKGQIVRVKFRPRSKKIRFKIELPRRQRPQPKDDHWNEMVDGEPGSNMPGG